MRIDRLQQHHTIHEATRKDRSRPDFVRVHTESNEDASLVTFLGSYDIEDLIGKAICIGTHHVSFGLQSRKSKVPLR